MSNRSNVTHLPTQARRIGERVLVCDTAAHHVGELSSELRVKDRMEILGLGFGVKKALWRAYKSSVFCRTAFVDGEIAAMWGLCLNWRPGLSLLGNLGVPWLHTSVKVEEMPVAFVKAAKREVAAMKALRPQLENFVLADYAEAVKLLKILGFSIDDPAPVGVNGVHYCRFHMGFE